MHMILVDVIEAMEKVVSGGSKARLEEDKQHGECHAETTRGGQPKPSY